MFCKETHFTGCLYASLVQGQAPFHWVSKGKFGTTKQDRQHWPKNLQSNARDKKACKPTSNVDWIHQRLRLGPHHWPEIDLHIVSAMTLTLGCHRQVPWWLWALVLSLFIKRRYDTPDSKNSINSYICLKEYQTSSKHYIHICIWQINK